MEENLLGPPLVTVTDLAEFLKLSVRSIWRNVSAGLIPKPIHVGSAARWRPTDIQGWLNGAKD
jgi:predicted DNA-binding transcriptional regulator AlpA